jgi:hypothetical protein
VLWISQKKTKDISKLSDALASTTRNGKRVSFGRERLRRTLIFPWGVRWSEGNDEEVFGFRKSKAARSDAFGLSEIIKFDQGSTESHPTREGDASIRGLVAATSRPMAVPRPDPRRALGNV